MKELDEETEGVIAELERIVGSLSDLRYGRFEKSGPTVGGEGLREEVIEALRSFREGR